MAESPIASGVIVYDSPGFDEYVHDEYLIPQLSAIPTAYHYGRASERRAILEENNYTSLEIIRNPKISFQKRFHDFGVIQEGEKPTFSFKFKNTGNANLQIQWVASSNTTRVNWPKGIIKPGAGGEIIVIYDSTGKEGEEEVVVNVIANTDPELAEARFRAFIQADMGKYDDK
jgi:hypothetical protein